MNFGSHKPPPSIFLCKDIHLLLKIKFNKPFFGRFISKNTHVMFLSTLKKKQRKI